MTRLLLIRHRRSTRSAADRIQGWANPPLDEVRREQASRLEKSLIGLPTEYSPFGFDNGSLSIVELDPTKPRIVLVNDTCHRQGGET